MTILLSDGTAHLHQKLRNHYQIQEIPAHVSLGEPHDFTTYFSSLDSSHEYLLVTSSSVLNPMYFMASSVVRDFPHVTVIDSKSISIAYGMLLIETAYLLKEGKSNKDIGMLLREKRHQQKTLLYLHRRVYGKHDKPSLTFSCNPWFFWQRIFVAQLANGRIQTLMPFLKKAKAQEYMLQKTGNFLAQMDSEDAVIGIVAQQRNEFTDTLKNIMLLLGCREDHIVVVETLPYQGLNKEDVFMCIMDWNREVPITLK